MSLPGSNRPPYRAPCEGTVLCGSGPRNQHARADEKNIPVWLYNAQVPDWATDGDYIDPYERPVPFNSCTESPCSGEDTCPDPTSSATPCLDWIGPAACQYLRTAAAANPVPVSWYQPSMLATATIADAGSDYLLGETLQLEGGTVDGTYMGDNAGTAAVTVTAINESGGIMAVSISDTGCYQTPPSTPANLSPGHGTGASVYVTFVPKTTNLAVCHKFGYKNVQARRQWHGIPGFMSSPVGIYYCGQYLTGVSVDDGGSGYSFGDVLVVNGGTGTGDAATIAVAATDDSGAITLVYIISSGYYTDLPDSPNSVTLASGGGGTGATISLTFSDAPIVFNPYSDTAPDSKYTSAAISISQSASATTDGGDITQSGESSWSVSVDPLTGIQTVSDMSLFDPCTYWDAYDNYINPTNNIDQIPASPNAGALTEFIVNTALSGGVLVSLNSDGSGGAVYDSGYPFALATDFDVCCYTYNYYEFSCSDSVITFYQHSVFFDDDQQGYLDTTTTITLSGSNTAEDVQADMKTLLATWPLNDDILYPWRTDNYTSIAPLVTRNEVPYNVNPLSFGPAMNGDPIDDCNGNDPSNPAWIPTYEQIPEVDPNAGLYDSTILGAPMPAGYQGYFDFAYQDYQVCETDDPPGPYLAGWGQKNTGQYGIPLNATQWSNLTLGEQYGPGAWIFYNHNPSWIGCANNYNYDPGVYCIAQKWAETKMPFASQNFFRPAGNDRFAYDETQVYSICATSNMGMGPGGNNQGAEISLEQTANCGEVTIADSSGLWGGPAVGGFYEIASVSAATGSGCGNACVVTLGTQIYNVPDNWVSTGDGDDASCFGKLRWSTGDAATDPPPIPGRAGISAIAEYDSESDVTELTTDSLPNLGMIISGNDSVDIYDNAMGLLAGNLAVTRVDDSHFTVTAPYSDLTNAAWLMTHGAPSYYWNDQFPKGDYAYTDWTWWPRLICEATRINALNSSCTTGGCSDCPDTETLYAYPFTAFTQEAGCVAFNPCNPSVLCISPNGETFPNGVTYGFTIIDFDEQYGSGWQAEIQQVMEDLLSQNPPHYPAQGAGCSSLPFAWNQDNGTCEPDTDEPPVKYYPYPPLVECRLTVPAGAPALPAGITIGWDTPVGIESGSWSPDYGELPPPSDGNILFPPQSNGLGLESATIWGLWEVLCGCATGGGRFAGEYSNIVTGCS